MMRFSVLIFYLLILFLPTQLGRHFFLDFSFVSGIRVDYLAPTIYLTDIFVLTLFALWLIDKIGIKKHESRIKGLNSMIHDSKFMILSAFAALLVFGILLSKNQAAAWFGLLRFLELVFLGFYAAINIKKMRFETILFLFSIGIVFEFFLSIAQYLNQGSIGGIFYFFGERSFNGQTPGIANASIDGKLVLRPYGTFPHPNVLAGYLLVGMILILYRIKNYESRIMNHGKTLLIFSMIAGTIGLLLTMSRIAIILWLFIVGFHGVTHVIKKIKNAKPVIHDSLFIIRILVVLVFIGSIFMLSPLGHRFTNLKLADESIVVRQELIKSSLLMIKENLFLGVGLNNFLIELPGYQKINNYFLDLQPVHNIFLLVATETGLIGLVFFLWFMFKTYQRIMNHELRIKDKNPIIHNSKFIILTAVLILGLFDHYFLTLQQGQLLFSFILGLCWANMRK